MESVSIPDLPFVSLHACISGLTCREVLGFVDFVGRVSCTYILHRDPSHGICWGG